jgi:hypothetical protein
MECLCNLLGMIPKRCLVLDLVESFIAVLQRKTLKARKLLKLSMDRDIKREEWNSQKNIRLSLLPTTKSFPLLSRLYTLQPQRFPAISFIAAIFICRLISWITSVNAPLNPQTLQVNIERTKPNLVNGFPQQQSGSNSNCWLLFPLVVYLEIFSLSTPPTMNSSSKLQSPMIQHDRLVTLNLIENTTKQSPVVNRRLSVSSLWFQLNSPQVHDRTIALHITR